MPRYSAATWKPLPEADREPLITATQVICHSAVSDAASLWPYFARDDVVLESHFYVNEQGGVEEYIDTDRQADANLTANVRAISIETWDGRDPDHTPWNPAQLDALTELIAWCCRTHDIPALKCAGPSGPGIGWHTMWGAPSPWTPVQKTCPGAPRIAQMPDLIARVWATVHGGFLMAQLTDAQARELFDDISGDGRLKEVTLLARQLAGLDPLEPSDLAAGGDARPPLKTLVQGAILDGLRKSETPGDGRGMLRAPMVELLREAMAPPPEVPAG